jgi:purine nucleosidase
VQTGDTRLLIDTDMGCDDAVALLMAAAAPGAVIEAVTVVAGNVPVARGVRNALAVLSVAGRDDVPVHGGLDRPLLWPAETAPNAHGRNGLGDVEMPAPARPAEREHAVDVIGRLARGAPGQLTLVTLGPLTNLAAALVRDRDLLRRFRRVCLMAGAPDGVGNVASFAEYNVWADPEAAEIVLGSGAPLTLVGLELSRQAAELGWEARERLAALGSPAAGLAARLAAALAVRGTGTTAAAALLPDPLAMAVALRPDLIRAVTRARVGVDRSVEGRGILLVDEAPDGQVAIVSDADGSAFQALLMDLMGPI